MEIRGGMFPSGEAKFFKPPEKKEDELKNLAEKLKSYIDLEYEKRADSHVVFDQENLTLEERKAKQKNKFRKNYFSIISLACSNLLDEMCLQEIIDNEAVGLYENRIEKIDHEVKKYWGKPVPEELVDQIDMLAMEIWEIYQNWIGKEEKRDYYKLN